VTSPANASARSWRPAWPCDPFEVLLPIRRGVRDPAFRHDPDGTVWRVTLTPDGPATLRIRSRPSVGLVELEAWGSGRDWVLEQAPELLGADDDASSFRPRDERVRTAWVRNPHWRVMRSRRVLEALTAAVIEQKVTGQEAFGGWRRLLRRFGAVGPGPGEGWGMHCPPTAEVLAQIPSWEWLRCQIDGARSRPIVRAARAAESLERTVGMPSDQVEGALTSLPGVGVWTAAEVRQRAHGDADAVSFGDYHVATQVGWALTGEPVTDSQLAVLLEADRPHRYRVQHLVTRRMAGPPRRGARMALRRHLPR